jgi:hypothetical protein
MTWEVNDCLPSEETSSTVILSYFAQTTLEHTLIKGILFALLYEIYGDYLLGVSLTYAEQFKFSLTKRGTKLDHKIGGVPFSFFQTTKYHKLCADEAKRASAHIVT